MDLKKTSFEMKRKTSKRLNFSRGFSPKEMNSIKDRFSIEESPIHFLFQTGIRYLKKVVENGACALSPHFIGLFKKNNLIYQQYANIPIASILKIKFSIEDHYVFIKIPEGHLVLDGDGIIIFSQLLYRNLSILFPSSIPLIRDSNAQSDNSNMSTSFIPFSIDSIQNFPIIDVTYSLSQQFQLSYSAFCSLHKIKYDQRIVNYIHHFIRSKVGILDLGILPSSLFNTTNQIHPVIDFIITNLLSLKQLSGFYCHNCNYPNILSFLVPYVANFSRIKILYLENCQISKGCELLAREASKETSKLSLQYISFKGNRLTDLSKLAYALNYSRSSVVSLDISDNNSANLSKLFMLFQVQANKLKYLSFDAKCLSESSSLTEFLKLAQKVDFFTLLSIHGICADLYSNTNFNASQTLFDALQNVPIKKLHLPYADLTEDEMIPLLNLLRKSPCLEEVNFSHFHGIVDILIDSVMKNHHSKYLSFILEGIPMSASKMQSITQNQVGKVKELRFEVRRLSPNDTTSLITFLKSLPSLRSLTITGSFLPQCGESLSELSSLNLSSLSLINTELRDDLRPLLLKLSPSEGSILGDDYSSSNDELSEGLTSSKSSKEFQKNLHKLQFLDISGNHCPYDYATILNFNKSLISFNCDRNDESLENIKNLSKAALSHEKLEHFRFPTDDTIKIFSEGVNNSQLTSLYLLRARCLEKINENRKRIPELPIPTNIVCDQSLINKITSRSINSITPFSYNEIFRHSASSRILNLSLPYQNIGDDPLSGGRIRRDSYRPLLSACNVYGSKSLSLYIIESSYNPSDVYPSAFNPPIPSPIETQYSAEQVVLKTQQSTYLMKARTDLDSDISCSDFSSETEIDPKGFVVDKEEEEDEEELRTVNIKGIAKGLNDSEYIDVLPEISRNPISKKTNVQYHRSFPDPYDKNSDSSSSKIIKTPAPPLAEKINDDVQKFEDIPVQNSDHIPNDPPSIPVDETKINKPPHLKNVKDIGKFLKKQMNMKPIQNLPQQEYM